MLESHQVTCFEIAIGVADEGEFIAGFSFGSTETWIGRGSTEEAAIADARRAAELLGLDVVRADVITAQVME